jgi:hypothetical protein
VCLSPELLPAILSVNLAMGAKMMAKVMLRSSSFSQLVFSFICRTPDVVCWFVD